MSVPTSILLAAADTTGVDLKSSFMLNARQSVAEVFGTPAAIINTLLPNIYVVSGVFIFGLLVFGGLSIIASGGDPKGVEKGSNAIKSALIGFLIIITAYWIIQIVQIVTGVKILGA